MATKKKTAPKTPAAPTPPARDPASKWYSTPAGARKRKPFNLSLPPDALEQLEALAAKKDESKSQVVETLIRRAYERIDR